jgi:glycosyltransferase involved in cell wall biosynthesis
MRYWATAPADLLGLSRALGQADWDVVIASGLQGLFYLRQIEGRSRIWYPSDEMATAVLTQIRLSNPLRRTRVMLSEAARLLLIQRMWRDIPDQIWVVAEKDRRSMRRIVGDRDVVSIPNGVDQEFFRPVEVETQPNSAVFWGRLDFGPNEQALEFFIGRVWPLIRAARADASLRVMGYSPSEAVRRLTAAPGVELLADAPDIRPVVCSAPVALYPFFSGTGIKNKLLEGAALARALIVSPNTVEGMRDAAAGPWRLAASPESWRDALLALWDRPAEASALGAAARDWVERNYSWERAGALAEENLERALARRRRAAS